MSPVTTSTAKSYLQKNGVSFFLTTSMAHAHKVVIWLGMANIVFFHSKEHQNHVLSTIELALSKLPFGASRYQ